MNEMITGSVNEQQLERALEELTRKVRSSGFLPDRILYVETGARRPAARLSELLGIPAGGISAVRGGDGLKKRIAPLLARSPLWVTRALRWIEEFSRLHRFTRRRVSLPQGMDLAGQSVLLFDDASDTGKTVQVVTEHLVAAGLDRKRLRVAVLAATTELARAQVHFWIIDHNVRFPWSPDSRRMPSA